MPTKTKGRGGAAIARRGPAPVSRKRYDALARRVSAAGRRVRDEAKEEEMQLWALGSAGAIGYFGDRQGRKLPTWGLKVNPDLLYGAAIGLVAPRLKWVKGKNKTRARAISLGLLVPLARGMGAGTATMLGAEGDEFDDEFDDE